MESTYVPGLDDLLGGGLRQGALCLVAGHPGSGRTTFGLQMAVYGALAGDGAVYVSVEDDRSRLAAAARSATVPLAEAERAGRLRLMSASAEQLVTDLSASPGIVETTALEMGARRVVVDGLAPLVAADPELARRASLAALRAGLTRHGLTCVLMADEDAPETAAMAHVADSVLRLSVRQDLGGAARQMAVEKQRGAPARPGRYAMAFGVGGLYVGDGGDAAERMADAESRPSAESALTAWPSVGLRPTGT